MNSGADADQLKASTAVTRTSVGYLRTCPKSANYPGNNRIAPNALRAWQRPPVLTQYKQESDGSSTLSSWKTALAKP